MPSDVTHIAELMRFGDWLTARSLLAGPPSDSQRGKRSQRPNDYRLVSGDAPNRSWTDSVCKAAAAFLCFSVAQLIVGQPLQKATAL
jgi:hypothetical protein